MKVAELYKRADYLQQTGNNKEQTARKLSAEFQACAYVSKNKLWAQYRNEKQELKVVELSL